MLISKTSRDVTCKDGTTNVIFIISPVIPNYPQAKFPGKYIRTTLDLLLNVPCSQVLLFLGNLMGRQVLENIEHTMPVKFIKSPALLSVSQGKLLVKVMWLVRATRQTWRNIV